MLVFVKAVYDAVDLTSQQKHRCGFRRGIVVTAPSGFGIAVRKEWSQETLPAWLVQGTLARGKSLGVTLSYAWVTLTGTV